jgi:hypothetical protein
LACTEQQQGPPRNKFKESQTTAKEGQLAMAYQNQSMLKLTLVVVGVVLHAQLLDALPLVLLHGRDGLELALHPRRAIGLRGRLEPLPPGALLRSAERAAAAKAARSKSGGRGYRT